MKDATVYTDADIFSQVLENIETGIIILDMVNRRVFYRNRYAGKILEFLHTSCDFEELHSMMFSGLEQVENPGKTRSKRTMLNCDHRTFGYTIYRLQEISQYVAVIIQDITDQSRLEAIDEASEMMNNISYVFSGIRHEIGNPLNSVKMALTVLKNNLEKFSKEEIKIYIDRMADDAAKMESLLKSFKNFNMFEKPKTVSVNLQEFFESLTQLLGADVRKKKIQINIDILPEGRWVSVDTRALQHVSMNILANALDALDGRENPTLKIIGEAVGDVVLLSIKDNGCGMPDDLIVNAFKPFYTTKPHGTGLGLVISKKMLAQMNCGITISSEKDKGTTVNLTMPKCPPPGGNGESSEPVYHQ
ncbi:MAG: HAMP domain-containing histidine kinase [Proteobacteria bacterium]|nr:HAMP domain-containing histidine kinase [Pseudomonadota bacterium]MBU1738100.1 HAMP domain-containing histidine kinase [Pseudomonadota bacterium]